MQETTDGEGRRDVGPVELCDYFEEYEKNGRYDLSLSLSLSLARALACGGLPADALVLLVA
jgi:hypothetical protein